MKGKDKCRILKELRAQIAAANDIEWVTENCSHKGECRGTCPKCEAEVVMLERALERRRALGKTVALTGLAAGMIATTTACSMFESWQVTDGEMLPPDQTTTVEKQTTSPSETITGEIESVTEGEMVMYLYYTDFTLFDARTFKTTDRVVFESVVDSDGNHSSDTPISEGVRFDIVGETKDYWLISYEDGYYCIWKDCLDECAVEVQTDETIDESDDSAAEDGE